ncbi:unnamed protein product [Chondrus crispus]|uniref:Uncharacterized protein n=1 Tax=Chondrus crispus TaxID=2769 RepID=R7QSF5_CHOCR|nr:unnamed protein product [Chondrus crispus]CDF40673.1 unnamed protein product [Chondrus crispus]|eukprot:XP_005710967.1 unnamed protein product [Chondrus crispus]
MGRGIFWGIFWLIGSRAHGHRQPARYLPRRERLLPRFEVRPVSRLPARNPLLMPAASAPRPMAPSDPAHKILDLLKLFTDGTTVLGPDVDLSDSASVARFLAHIDTSPAAKSLLQSLGPNTAFGSFVHLLAKLSGQALDAPLSSSPDPAVAPVASSPYLRAASATLPPPKPLSRLLAVSYSPTAPHPRRDNLPRLSRKLQADLRYHNDLLRIARHW